MKFTEIKSSKSTINEGVKFSNTEKNLVLSNSDNFNVGIEYEFHVPGGATTALNPDTNLDYNEAEVPDFATLSLSYIEEYVSSDDAAPLLTLANKDIFESKAINGKEQGICLFSKNPDKDTARIGIVFNSGEGQTYLYKNNNSTPSKVKTLGDFINNQDDQDYTAIKRFFEVLNSFKDNLSDDEDTEFSKKQSEKMLRAFSKQFIESLMKNDNISLASDITLNFDENPFFNEYSPYELSFIRDYINIIDDYIKPFNLSRINYGDTRPETFNNEVEQLSEGFAEDIQNFINTHGSSLDDVNINSHIVDTTKNNFEEMVNDQSIEYLIISVSYDPDITPDYFKKLEDNDDKINAIVPEDQGDQVEIITHKLTLNEALEHIKKIFKIINSKESLYTTNESGLHISVSHREDPKNVNLIKFLILHKMGYVSDIFPERKNVESIIDQLIQMLGSGRNLASFSKYAAKNQTGEFVKNLKTKFENNIIFGNKSFSINFSEFDYMDGRIELRYFGGRDYEERYDEIEHHLLRSLYLLTVSATDEYEKEYNKALYQILDQSFQEKVGMSISDIIYASKFFTKTSYERDEAVEYMMKKLGVDNKSNLDLIYQTVA